MPHCIHVRIKTQLFWHWFFSGTDSPEAVAALRAVHLTEQVETDGAVGTEDHRRHIQEWAFTYICQRMLTTLGLCASE